MSVFSLIAGVLILTALCAVINDKLLKMHRTIGVMLLTLSLSFVFLLCKQMGLIHGDELTKVVGELDFSNTLIHGMLGALLFAGAINIDFDQLQPRLFVITVLAVTGVLISTFVVGFLIYALTHALPGVSIPLVYCLTFGALISPTDPIAVLAILRSIGVSKGLDMDICGESLFNDGIGFVVFTFFFTLAVQSETMSAGEVSLFFLKSVGGGIVLAVASSYFTYLLMKMTDDWHVEILLTLALVSGSFQAAEWLEFSPAITIVVVGLVFGRLCYKNMSKSSQETLYAFWGVVDEVLNTMLFVMVGLLLVIIPLRMDYALLGIAAIAIVLFGRWISVLLPVALLKPFFFFSPRSVRILTWGGLRGGLPIAMALTLPDTPNRDIILWMTYSVVVFSIIIQGTTIGRVAGKRTTRGSEYQHPELDESDQSTPTISNRIPH